MVLKFYKLEYHAKILKIFYDNNIKNFQNFTRYFFKKLKFIKKKTYILIYF